MGGRRVLVKIVAKKKGCMMCDLAIGILKEIAPEFAPDTLQWQVVDVGSRQGIRRHAELTRICGRRPAVPSILMDGRIVFDHIPDMEALSRAVREAADQ